MKKAVMWIIPLVVLSCTKPVENTLSPVTTFVSENVPLGDITIEMINDAAYLTSETGERFEQMKQFAMNVNSLDFSQDYNQQSSELSTVNLADFILFGEAGLNYYISEHTEYPVSNRGYVGKSHEIEIKVPITRTENNLIVSPEHTFLALQQIEEELDAELKHYEALGAKVYVKLVDLSAGISNTETIQGNEPELGVNMDVLANVLYMVYYDIHNVVLNTCIETESYYWSFGWGICDGTPTHNSSDIDAGEIMELRIRYNRCYTGVLENYAFDPAALQNRACNNFYNIRIAQYPIFPLDAGIPNVADIITEDCDYDFSNNYCCKLNFNNTSETHRVRRCLSAQEINYYTNAIQAVTLPRMYSEFVSTEDQYIDIDLLGQIALGGHRLTYPNGHSYGYTYIQPRIYFGKCGWDN